MLNLLQHPMGSTDVSSTLIPITRIEYDKANANVTQHLSTFLANAIRDNSDDPALVYTLRMMKTKAAEQLATLTPVDVETNLTTDQTNAAKQVTNEISYILVSATHIYMPSNSSSFKAFAWICLYVFIGCIAIFYVFLSQTWLNNIMDIEGRYGHKKTASEILLETSKNVITLGLYGFYKKFKAQDD